MGHQSSWMKQTVIDSVVQSSKVGVFSMFSMDYKAPRKYSHGRNFGVARQQDFAADIVTRRPYAPYDNGMKKGPNKLSRNLVWTSKEYKSPEGNRPRQNAANGSAKPQVIGTGHRVSNQPRKNAVYGPRSSSLSDTRGCGPRLNGSPKKSVCNFWKDGNCKKGEKCQFLHSWSCFPGLAMVAALEGHKNDIKGIALPQGSDKLFSVSGDGTLLIWDCNSGQCVRSINLQAEAGSLISEGPWVFLGLPNAVKAFNVQNSKDVHLEGVVGQVHAMTAANGMLFAGTSSGSILVWKATDSESDPFKYLTSLEGHHSGEVTCFVVGGEVLYSGSVDKTIKVWDLNTLQCRMTLKQHIGTVTSLLCWDKCLISSSLDGTIKLWACSENESLKVVQTRKQELSVHTLCGMHDAEAKPIMFCSYQNGAVGIFDLPSFEERGKMFSTQTICTLTIGPGGLLFSGDKSGNLRVWSLASGTKV
ncbi:Zinc finger CCCH domain-containing protein 59 [Arabidopsis thaliana]|uniref:Zinc finger CCCH domain-containing protein 59 n=7 Tax=Arabidopsis TaxID=3701 RepID=C3H59_ARATH|nr:WD-40 repeat family protein / zfwd3 protein (ZFWD3) [Arabidopsis thaliana]Q9FKR9.1 RecName: Full=Zinc finger CCCH domain-containing protein 59; Short=AtC3H59; AltName: Full=Zinc finger CCCH domain and WD40 repeat-containing protein 3 [Arabidopsis thaliana]KAG7604462.1 WD40-repeat-containing domain superfamily [Arabidopsis thaliana x Arabidopsis arenosa]KAG7611390.1 WD40-repeat-containing domain superfamily [Arabidopsis suecica]ABO45703.1 At5g40880 [Arabidopsis thaliana]AED94611.1 WD-40 repe|eukprot:NP_198904.1 WD-40 repeat family protein / zfwd3 protein (ZFWD3) [Arabidopsis thaliana]